MKSQEYNLKKKFGAQFKYEITIYSGNQKYMVYILHVIVN